jgi:hypothetical protein
MPAFGARKIVVSRTNSAPVALHTVALRDLAAPQKGNATGADAGRRRRTEPHQPDLTLVLDASVGCSVNPITEPAG